MKAFQGTDQFTVRNFFKQLSQAFGDPRSREKALKKLNTIRQGSRPFGEFLTDVDRLMLKAGV
jgi:hypothetical protein